MPDGDISELNVDATLAGQNVCNVHHFVQVGSDGTGDARTGVADMWIEDFQAVFLDCLSDQFALSQLRARRIQPTQTQSLITAAAGAGDLATEPLPNQSCAILRQHAVPLLRRGTGHVKLSGITVDNVSDGRISTALAILIDLFAAKMIADQTDSGSGYTFRSAVYSSVDSIARKIVRVATLGAVKTVYSRSLGVGS